MDKILEQVLRITPEPYTYITDQEVHQLLTAQPDKYYQFIKHALVDITHNKASIELPPKQIFSGATYQGDWRVMPCQFTRGKHVRKTVKLVGTNFEQRVISDQITVGKAFAIHPHDNHIMHIFEACLLSSARTGLCATLAVDLLASITSKITIIGCGRVAYYAALYITNICQVDDVYFYDTNKQRAENMVTALNNEIEKTNFHCLTTPHDVDTDIVIVATNSEQAILSPDDTNATLIISLGADTETQHELSNKWPQQATLFVDTKDSIRYGDLSAWQRNGLCSSDDLTDIFGLLRDDKMNKADDEQRVFISTGSALFDNLTIDYLISDM
ncbi:MAG: hypothetical protein OEX83_05585 [Gammaproteobacteria bacterium]|nr:hypothetical protein [Gammaproteobacteria bacterium]